MASPPMPLAGMLRQLRTQAGLTQEELAEAAGLSPRSISDLERGVNRTARKETTRLLADALQLQGSARVVFEATARGRSTAPQPFQDDPDPSLNRVGVSSPMPTLPRDTAMFAGREEELTQLTEALGHKSRDGYVVAVHAIDGMAGIGKTAFAVHAAHLLRARFPDGQFFLRLHGHTPGQRPTEPGDALTALLLTLGVPAQRIPAHIEARAALWRDQMSGKRALVVLDDATGSDQIRPLLPGAAETLVLVTSRRRLAALPEAVPLTLDTLQPSHAAELFTRLVGRRDVRTSDTGVADLLRLCGYLPLAISLMAGQLKHHRAWTVADLSADLAPAHDRLTLMRAEDHSVAAAFDLSYRDLTADQQRFFRRLGLQLGADIDAYAAAALADTSLTSAAALLEGLYTHHLIDEPVRGRYRFHDLIREHARKLALGDEPTDCKAATTRLLAYYLHAARIADRRLARRTPISLSIDARLCPRYLPQVSARDQAVAWMEAERLNLHSAVDRASAEENAAYAVAIPAAMHGFLRINGHWRQALALHQMALAAARREKDLLGEAVALANIGDMEYLTGDYPAATVNLTKALQLFRDLGNRLGEANSLSTSGLVHRQAGNHAAAAVSQEQAIKLYRAVADELGEAVSLSELGYAQYLAGDYESATASLRASLPLLGDLADQNGQAAALIYLAAVHKATTDYDQATASLDRALRLYEETGTPWGEANVLLALGDMQQLTGDGATAAVSLNRALRLYRELGHRSGEAEALNSMGELSTDARTADAFAYHAEALAIARDISAPLEEARALEGIGRCHLHSGNLIEGESLLRQALHIYRSLNSPHIHRIELTLSG